MRFIPISLLAMLGTAFSAPPERHQVAGDLRDPMELAVASDGDLYVVEREGRVLRVRPSTGGVFVIGQVKVTALRSSDPDSGYAREDGLLGIALDPGFSKNRRIYLYYSHPVEMLNRLSRFELKDGALDLSSEKKLLDVAADRDKRVCHHGGAIQFGPDGLLYLSTGDNTNPFESDGRAPLDDREDRAHADAMRSAGNSADLRGKILRIRLTENGYEIPKGNLFKPGTANTRPEIYVMGCRNPFRTSIDPKTGTLYWGEVGPDAGEPSPRGPRGHDELNQAKAAGNFGWPFVIADNQPYPMFDFASDMPGKVQDPAAPTNPGHRNSGLKDLPPANPALIYYPYANSEKFPALGSGGRNAMAGPVFYHDPKRKFNLLGPEDNRTVLMYEWMRGKILKVKLDEKENLISLDPFADGFVHPMDMEMAEDGTVWLLEYGSDWWFNTNGRILRLRPESGNQIPVIEIERAADHPMTFSVKNASDPDGDKLALTWWVTEGVSERSLGSDATITITSGGATEVRAVADDGKGGISVARFPLVEAPSAESLVLELGGDPKALAFAEAVDFKIRAGKKQLDPAAVQVRARYIPIKGHDSEKVAFPAEITKLLTSRQCLACHQIDQPSVGPRYTDVALKYTGREDAASYLAGKIRTGGSGAWGQIPMPPQIAVTDAEAATLARAILGLSQGMSETRGSMNGKIILAPPVAGAEPGGAWEITAEAPGYSGARLRLPAK